MVEKTAMETRLREDIMRGISGRKGQLKRLLRMIPKLLRDHNPLWNLQLELTSFQDLVQSTFVHVLRSAVRNIVVSANKANI